MDETIAPIVAGVRFAKVGKIYHFDARNVPDLKIGDQVVVETSRGWQLGSVAQVLPASEFHTEGMKSIDRRATPRDLVMKQSWQAKEAEVLQTAKSRAVELGLVGVKVVHAEYSYDGSRLTILFSTESEDKFDLKTLRQDMQRAYNNSQVELRQIGPRDVAKMIGGMGACGLEQRCCSQFLCEFSSISIRMAKEQGISLTPTEITGMCGRLRCCLIYEYEQYTQARALLPRKNRRVMTPQGEGRVLDQIPIRDSVYVVLSDDQRREFKRSEIQLIDENGGLTPAMSEEERRELNLEVPAIGKPVEDENESLDSLSTPQRENFGVNRNNQPFRRDRRSPAQPDQSSERRDIHSRGGINQAVDRSTGRSDETESLLNRRPGQTGRPAGGVTSSHRTDRSPHDHNRNRPGGNSAERSGNTISSGSQPVQQRRSGGGPKPAAHPKGNYPLNNRMNRPHGVKGNRTKPDWQEHENPGHNEEGSKEKPTSE
jgi:cell fate regulator YaaT (PSP1 superfamily)